ncbi:MAG: hypothetical protein WCP34_15910 [Pseudomonadota bacterium]
MLKSYEAIYDHGNLTWLGDAPLIEYERVLVITESHAELMPNIRHEDVVENIIKTTFGAWGKRSREEVDRIIAEQRERDWGEGA